MKGNIAGGAPKIAPSTKGDLGPHRIHASWGPPKSTFQMASRLVQQFCRDHGCEQQTDHATFVAFSACDSA